jgi:hypothetical protein
VAITTAFVPLLLMAPIVSVTAQAAESKQVVGHGTGGDTSSVQVNQGVVVYSGRE